MNTIAAPFNMLGKRNPDFGPSAPEPERPARDYLTLVPGDAAPTAIEAPVPAPAVVTAPAKSVKRPASAEIMLNGTGQATLYLASDSEKLWISAGDCAHSYNHGSVYRRHGSIDLRRDEAITFLTKLRDGASPVTAGRNEYISFEITESAPVFSIHKHGSKRAARKFPVGWSYDVKAMAETLLAPLTS